MSERSQYKPGTPSWVDLSSPDPDGSSKFYSDLFGWEVLTSEPVEQTGGYRMAYLNDKPVAGIAPIQMEGQPTAWTTYMSVENADKVTEKVKENGGDVIIEPMDVMEFGRMAVYTDPEGAVFSVWQPGKHIGAELVNEPGALCWNELNTRDSNAAEGFYSKVFDWSGESLEGGPMPYTNWKMNGDLVGGMIQMTDQWPADIPPYWNVYFGVDDCDEACKKAQDLGATVMVEPMDIPSGRIALLQDPQGAMFSVSSMDDLV